MTRYEELLDIAEKEGITVIEYDFTGDAMGIYCDGCIFINKWASSVEKACTLAEEIGHHHTASKNILSMKSLESKKQELQGRRWGIKKVLLFDDIIDAIIGGCERLSDIAEHLDITEGFLSEALNYYYQKYGPSIAYDNYMVILSPNSVIVYPAL